MNFHFEEERKRERRMQIIKEVIRWAIEIVAVIVLAFLLVHFFLMRTSMIGGSMEDTLLNGQEVLINKGAYLFMSPSRNDVIAFYQSGDEEEATEDASLQIRRVIGMPGEKIQITGGKIYIDGAVYEEKYTMEAMESGGVADSEVKLGEDEYFVLGDCRNNSADSRFRSFGNVKKKNIVGKVSFKLDPFSLIGGPTVTAAPEATVK